MMPLAGSVTERVTFGLIAYTLLKLASGQGREVHPMIYAFAVVFLGRYNLPDVIARRPRQSSSRSIGTG